MARVLDPLSMAQLNRLVKTKYRPLLPNVQDGPLPLEQVEVRFFISR